MINRGVYPFSQNSLQQLLSAFYKKITECIDNGNEAMNMSIETKEEMRVFLEETYPSLVKWLKEEGVPQETQRVINDMYLDGRLGELINDTLLKEINDKVDDVENKLTQLSINVMNYGAIGDGINDDTQAVNLAIRQFKDGVANYLLFPQGYTFKCNFEITNPNVKICGGGIIDGTISVFIQEGTSNFQAEDLTLIGSNPIHFKRCRGGAIRKCSFLNNDISILFKANEGEQGQTNARIQISDNLFENNGYVIKQEQIVSSRLSLADFHFINNISKWSKYTHIELETCDGFIVTGNTFFTDKNTATVKNHIKVSVWASWCLINSNNLFESGSESIYLHGVDSINISNNELAWCGRRERVGAIRISNSSYKTVYGIISNNVINVPSQTGIVIENTSYILIKDNFITLEEMRDFIGNAPLDENKWFGVYVTNNTQNRLNLTINNKLSRRNKQCNPTNEIVSPSFFEYDEVDEVVTTLNGYYDEIRISSISSITNILNGYEGKRLVITSEVNFVTIINKSTIKLRNNVDCKLGQFDQLTLLYKNGMWIELSRNNFLQFKVLISTNESEINLINDESIIRLTNGENQVIVNSLTNGYNGKTITLISNGTKNTIAHSVNLKLKESANVVIPNGRSLTLVCDNNVWYEVGRSFV